MALRISFVLSRHTDQNEAACLAIEAVTGMRQTHPTPAPTCLRRQTVDGGAILDVLFHVRDVRRGSEHVLDEAESRLWDLLHEHRIPYALRPRQTMSRENSVGSMRDEVSWTRHLGPSQPVDFRNVSQ